MHVEPTAEYHEIGIRSFGRGVFHKPPVYGTELGGKRVFAIATGDLVISNVFAWEGAVAVASIEDDGRIGSHRFMTWIADPDEADANYLRHYFTSDAGLKQLQEASPGSAGRNKTLGIKAFEDLVIPLPDIDEQRAIADRLEKFLDIGAATASDLEVPAHVFDSIEFDLIERYLAKSQIALGEISDINPRPSRLTPNKVHFIPMADVDDVTGTISGNQLVDRADLGSGYKQFLAGDLIFARITPCMQNGKSAVFSGSLSPIGYGSTEFHVVRAHDPALVDRLHTLLRSRWFRNLAKSRFTGTAGQQRVPADFLRTVLVPDLSGAAGASLVRRLDSIDRERRHLRQLNQNRAQLRSALPQAARNEVFSRLV
ncbi:MAG: restriction endonuclease subunit S [Sciscionella sp.]